MLANVFLTKVVLGRRLSRLTGFTLIELVVVMAMIGLLLSLATPRYFATVEQGKVKVQEQNLSTLRDAIDKFFGDNGRYPNALDELVKNKYLRSIPVDPITEKRDWLLIAPSDAEMGAIFDITSAVKKENDLSPKE